MRRKFNLSALAVVIGMILPLLASCGIPGALGRSFNRMMDRSVADDETGKAREAMFESLREIDRELETAAAVNPREEDSTR